MTQKVVALGITLWYFIDYWVQALDTYIQVLRVDYEAIQHGPETHSHLARERFLKYAVTDWWVSYIFGVASTVLNILVVMGSGDMLGMILNGLAVSWIGTLDEGYKGRIFGNMEVLEHMAALCMVAGTAVPDSLPSDIRLKDEDYFEKRCCCVPKKMQTFIALFFPPILLGFGAIGVFICTA